MDAFLAAAFAFPTVVFTVLLVLFVLYAAATLIGAADIEWLDHLLGVDHVHDSVLEGVMSALGIAGVPITIFGGIASIFAWLTSFTAAKFLPDSLLINSGILAASAVAGVLVSSVLVRPLRVAFVTADAPRRNEMVGKICTIRSLRVNEMSGTAEVGHLVAEVRCFHENSLTLGSEAIVYDYDADAGVYHVGPIPKTVDELESSRPELSARGSQLSGAGSAES
ncbi:MAG TPA: hypothetical protein VEK57_22500 [Thermoanaerobaculia bacterium]|nr:hypothetical protein [Thermoanaerobaculia bacterium]